MQHRRGLAPSTLKENSGFAGRDHPAQVRAEPRPGQGGQDPLPKASGRVSGCVGSSNGGRVGEVGSTRRRPSACWLLECRHGPAPRGFAGAAAGRSGSGGGPNRWPQRADMVGEESRQRALLTEGCAEVVMVRLVLLRRRPIVELIKSQLPKHHLRQTQLQLPVIQCFGDVPHVSRVGHLVLLVMGELDPRPAVVVPEPLQKRGEVSHGGVGSFQWKPLGVGLPMAMHRAREDAAKVRVPVREQLQRRIGSARVANNKGLAAVDVLRGAEAVGPSREDVQHRVVELALHPAPRASIVDKPPMACWSPRHGQQERLLCGALQRRHPLRQHHVHIPAQAREGDEQREGVRGHGAPNGPRRRRPGRRWRHTSSCSNGGLDERRLVFHAPPLEIRLRHCHQRRHELNWRGTHISRLCHWE
mmetsp:Transcript_32543/g.107294  ORF Transcript_32543/g.107294 Transcript_32543/m.107294 type:complete len:416 (-) Transcript_32543:71-1318(-)